MGEATSILQEQIPKVFEARSYYVMLASRVAEAFEVETRQIVQNVKNNPSLFPEKYAFQLTSDEVKSLRSMGMISKPGRGGSRELPWVITRKGAIRLATVMKGKKAIEAADIFIDIFDEVLIQLYEHSTNIKISNPSRIIPNDDNIEKLRKRIVKSLDDLLNTVINPKTNATFRDELQDITTTAISSVKEFLRSKKVDNEKVEAETLLIIEKARDIYERRQSELEDAKIDRETKTLNNFQKKIEIAEKLWDMYKKLEPNAVVDILGAYTKKDSLIFLPSPDQFVKHKRK